MFVNNYGEMDGRKRVRSKHHVLRTKLFPKILDIKNKYRS